MDFSLQITKQSLLIAAKNGFTTNCACSPLLINAYLNMIASGSSKESTLKQFLSVLGSDSVDGLNKNSEQLMAVLTDSGVADDDDDDDDDGTDDDDDYKSSLKIEGRPVVSFVNGVWVDQRFKLKDSFENILRSVYNVEPKFLDFDKNGDEVVKEVNSWTCTSTKGLIKNIIPDRSVDQNTMIILANALYFKGTWEHTFDPEMTQNRDFHLLNGETVQVSYMHQCSQFYKYGSFDGFNLIKLTYKTGGDKRRFSMYFFLPDKKDGLLDLIKKFSTCPRFVNQDFMLEETQIDNLIIPKFKIEVDFKVTEAMKRLTPTIPIINVGEFVEMVNPTPNGDECSRHIKILQKCYVEIDEEGTTAAAVDAPDMGFSLDYSPPPPLNFIADHPFLFMIREDASGVALFIGAVVDPLLN